MPHSCCKLKWRPTSPDGISTPFLSLTTTYPNVFTVSILFNLRCRVELQLWLLGSRVCGFFFRRPVCPGAWESRFKFKRSSAADARAAVTQRQRRIAIVVAARMDYE